MPRRAPGEESGEHVRDFLCAALAFTGLMSLLAGIFILAGKIIEAMLPLFDTLGTTLDIQTPRVWVPLVALLVVGGFCLVVLGVFSAKDE
jgi:hypothetical protein